jgi:hypothetical protein
MKVVVVDNDTLLLVDGGMYKMEGVVIAEKLARAKAGWPK